MKKFFYLLLLCLSVSVQVFGQVKQPRTQGHDYPLYYRIKADWFEHLKSELSGENWKYKDFDELLQREQYPKLVREKDAHGPHYQGQAPSEQKIYKDRFGKDMPRNERRSQTLKIVDLRGNNLVGEISDDPIWTFANDRFGTTMELGRFNFSTEFRFSHNRIRKFNAKAHWGGSSGNFSQSLLLDHNELVEFNPPKTPHGGLYVNGFRRLKLNNNRLEQVPDSWKDYRGLEYIASSVDTFRVDNNYFNFRALRKLKGLVNGKCPNSGDYPRSENFRFIYDPQKPLGEETEQTVSAGEAVTLNFSLPDGSNRYKWELNGKEVPLSGGKEYSFTVDSEQAGLYRCLVTNPHLPELTIKSRDRLVFLKKDGNRAPTDFALSNTNMPSNTFRWAVIGDFSGEDPDGDQLYYRLVGDLDGQCSSFRITDGKTLVASEELFNHYFIQEYRIQVEAYDIYGGRFQKEIVITRGQSGSVKPPANFFLKSTYIEENKVGRIDSIKLTGVAEGAYTLRLPDYKDNSFFEIKDSGLYTKVGLNHEEQEFYFVRLEAVSSDGLLRLSRDYKITATDVNDPAKELIITKTTIEVGKPKGTFVGVLVATDEDAGDIDFKYTLADSEDFVLMNKNQILSKRKFNATDLGDKTITVNVKDPHGAKRDFNLTLKVIEKPAPEGSRVELDNSLIKENKTGKVGTLNVNRDGVFSYKLVGGEGSQHNDRFEIQGDELRLTKASDYESEQVLSVRIKATGPETLEQSLSVSLTNVNEAPETLGLDNFQIKTTDKAETVLAKLILKDPDGDSGTFKLEDKHDASYFRVEGDRLLLAKKADKQTFVISLVGSDGEFSVKKEFVLVSDFSTGGTEKLEARIFTWSDFSLSAGQSLSLGAETNSDGAITYQLLTGAEFATLEGNTLKAVKEGTITLKATVSATEKYSGTSSTITVKILAEGAKQTAVIADWEDFSLLVGDHFTLGAYSDSDARITYELVSGAEYVSLSANKIEALKAGTATIKAFVAESESFLSAEKTITVTVRAKPELLPAVISNFENNSFPLSQGTFTLGAYSNSDAKVMYEIIAGNEFVSINGSLVTIKQAGTVKIRAYVEATDRYMAEEKAGSFRIVADGERVPITITGLEDLNINEDDTAFALQGRSESPAKVEYELLQGSEVVELDGPVLTPKKAGLATVKAYVKASGLYDAAETTFVVRVNSVMDVNFGENDLVLYPNPVEETLRIRVGSIRGETVVRIFNLLGTEVYNVSHKISDSELVMDLSDLPSGTYTVVLAGQTPEVVGRFNKR
ncbi:hypothetical protein FUAX_02240 [Fulvitalea axinellae]|uniref:Por secretion system C-terminal sorting domain-containing protein n=1 Tax=Fulvitalea axinellae TaxID=1182444 RepID=A0AAU9CR00_9BACT|nr:hypothetical protein FUAX_02240 [Fulvitalea axinellae]